MAFANVIRSLLPLAAGVGVLVVLAVRWTPSLCLTGHDSGVYSVVVPSDGKTFYSGSMDATIRIWSIAKEE